MKHKRSHIEYTETTKERIKDDYLFNKEAAESGLNRKREPENIVGTKKSTKMTKKNLNLECNQTEENFYGFSLFMDKELLQLSSDLYI